MEIPVPQPAPQPRVRTRLRVEAPEGSRLSSLLARLPELEARKKSSEEELSELKGAIQAEIAGTVEDPESLPDVFDIPASPDGSWPAYSLTSCEGSWGIDTEALKSQDPETYVRWARRGRPYWKLTRAAQGRGRQRRG